MIIRNATIENVHVDVNYALNEGIAMLSNIVVDTTFKNCTFVGTTKQTDTFGLINYIQGSTTNFTDCYFISTAKIGQKWIDGGWKVCDASNQTATYTIAGIKRYENAAAMEEAEVNNAFTSFAESGYWTVETGKVPVWKTKA